MCDIITPIRDTGKRLRIRVIMSLKERYIYLASSHFPFTTLTIIIESGPRPL
jgi:hypothetical protein